MRHRMTMAVAVLLGIALVTGYGARDAHAETTTTTGSVAAAGSAGSSGSAAGAAWNQGAVSGIESAVRAHTPVFPHRTCEITDPKYTSLVRQVTDGQGSTVQSVVWYYGDAINAAIADCHSRGGGVVVVPASGSRDGGGVYYSGAITLLSNVDLQVDTGATIKFVRNPSNAYYPVVLTSYQGYDLYDYSPLVYALNADNIALTGGGTLDAQDNVGGGWTLPSARPGAPSGTFAALGQLSADGVPADQRIFTDDGSLPATIPVLSGCPPQSRDWGPCASVRNVPPPRGAVAYASTFAPQFVEFNHSADVLVQGVHLVNTLFWELHPLNSRDVLVRNVTVDDTAHLTDDGIDPESCDDVEILDNSITTLDDGISVKSGRNRDGRDLRAPAENILITDNTFDNPSGGSASISIGSEMSGGIYDVFATGNTSGGDGTAYLLKIKTNSYRGGVIQGIYVRDSTMTQTIRGVLNLDTNYGESNPIPDTDVYNPVIRDIYLDDDNTTSAVTTTRAAIVVSNADAWAPFDNVVYENSVFYTPAAFQSAFTGEGAFFSHLTIRNVRFVNPQTGAVTIYDTSPTALAGPVTALAGGVTVPLTAGSGTVTAIPADTFTISGTVPPDFLSSGGTVSVYVDRDTTPVPVTVSPAGSFTSGPITLNNDEYWYLGRHYVAVSLADGIDVATVVYQLSVP
ncbi:MAG TPA: glycosyl hydrolase family 28 protein [Trebonia sp.]|jgi:polygalacturonase|nr:glycosyl hydrolase family 28 protein [Trebonia sp.]